MKDLDLNESPALPSSDGSADGATSNSLGGASMGDLKKGYHTITDESIPGGKLETQPLELVPSGFLGRPAGWER